MTQICQKFDNISFTELVQFIESESLIRFYFKNDWIDEALFIINDNPRLAIPATTIDIMVILDQGLDAWVEYCAEKNIDEQWAREFNDGLR